MILLLITITPARVYIVFSALDLCRIKARCAGKGCSLVKRRKAYRVLLPLLTHIPVGNAEPAQIQSAQAFEYDNGWG